MVSFYGNAQFAEPSVLFQVLQTARAFGRPCLVIGDFNWKPAYQCALDASGLSRFHLLPPFRVLWFLLAGAYVSKGSSGMPRAVPLLCLACPITKRCVSPGLGPRQFVSNHTSSDAVRNTCGMARLALLSTRRTSSGCVLRLAGPQAPLTSCQRRHWAFAGSPPPAPFLFVKGRRLQSPMPGATGSLAAPILAQRQ